MIVAWGREGGCILHILPHFSLEFADFAGQRCFKVDHSSLIRKLLKESTGTPGRLH